MIEFEYKGFWVESQPFDQTENGYPEDGITYTSYVYTSKQACDELEDYLEELTKVYDSEDDLKQGVRKAIDKYIKKKKLER
jgi:hypothetical protein